MKQKVLSMNLQFFAEQSDETTSETVTFENQSAFEAAVDERLAKSLDTAQSNWEKQAQKRIDQAREEGLTEGQRMAQMTSEEREKEQNRKQSAAVAEREAELTRRELRLNALEELAERKLPQDLISAVTLTTAEECTQSIDALEKAFREAVETGVNERLARSVEIPSINSLGNIPAEKGALGKRLAQNSSPQNTKSNFFKN